MLVEAIAISCNSDCILVKPIYAERYNHRNSKELKKSEDIHMEITEDSLKALHTNSQAGHIAYILRVAEKIGLEEALRIHADLHAKMADMVQEHLPHMGLEGNDAKAGMTLIEHVMEGHNPGILSLMDREKTEDTPQRVVSRHTGWCAVNEACKMLGTSPREFCPIPHEDGLTPLVQVINPKLSVRLGKLRPVDDCCELIVELQE